MDPHAGDHRVSNRQWDEDDVRVRPSRHKSRPRSKERPEYAEAVHATVVAVDRGRFRVLTDDGHALNTIKARELGRKGVVVGDSVWLVGDISTRDDALARIVRLDPRRTSLRRTADDTDAVERIIVANADQLGIVTAIADPEPNPRLIDRALVAAYDAGVEPILIVTKTDLADPDQLLRGYRDLDIRSVSLSRDQDSGVHRAGDLDELRAQLSNHVTVLMGSSGVGKSTLVNALVPGADRSTGIVNVVTGRGRHTSTSAIALALPGGGWIIDTPGVRSFGLAHVSTDSIVRGFDDLVPGTQHCPRGCSHDEKDCALDTFVASDPYLSARLDSLRRVLASRSTNPDDG